MPIPQTQAVERRSLREVTTERIREAILDGTLEPGERLQDRELMAWLGVSRTPLREALSELARLGFVEIEAQRFTRVAVPDDARADDYLHTLGVLLGGITRITVASIGGAAESEISASIERTLSAAEARDEDRFRLDSKTVVDLLLRHCPNAILVKATRDTVQTLIYRYAITQAASSIEWEHPSECFRRLDEAIVAHDAGGAQRAMEDLLQTPS